ncbi:hypothetical protein RD792_010863 [Penstemon davidsonii]|uniref:Protein kinase domain-containing protein n=1 Tax=Penstemon davidsonii TaxID=160366 RepID=A0ABR0D372_9LAMI|nr:hypothetical protein RD792_010863 [Penstemon davidsonii]
MDVLILQILGLVLKVCIFGCSLVIQGFADGEGIPALVPNANMFISLAPAPIPQQKNGTSLQPPLVSAPVPQTTKGLVSSPGPSTLSIPPTSIEDYGPAMPPIPSTHPPYMPQAPGSMTPKHHQTKAPNTNAPPLSAITPDVPTPPALPGNSPPVKSLPKESPSIPPDPSASKPLGHSSNSPSPRPLSTPTPGYNSPREHHHVGNNITPAPLSHMTPPPASSKKAPSYLTKSDPKANLRHSAPPPTRAVPFVSPKLSPSRSLPRNPEMPLPSPFQALPPPPPRKDCAPLTCADPLTYGPPESPCVCVLPIQVGLRLSIALYTFFPLVSELASEIASGIFMRQSQVRIMGANEAGDNPEKTIVLIDLVPLGENFDHTTAYLTFRRFWEKQVLIKTSVFGDYDVLYVRYPGLPQSPPLPPSTIGIIGSKPYPGPDNNGRTIKPLGVDVGRKQHRGGPNRSILATIVLSGFVAVILLCAIAWVLVFKHRDGVCQQDPNPTNRMPPSIAKSSGDNDMFFKNKLFINYSNLKNMANLKINWIYVGKAISMAGSGPDSPSSIAAYPGSAKTFTSRDIERATDYFNETRILGEGGFGRVYCGVFEDGTKVAMKILKRYDQQGGREFFAEVEMLSRLHHRNLVKLIGICTEDQTHCLVYELVPNGSVESHLHGIDKETGPLDWSARLKIALGAARGLAYLHEDSSPRVIHRDFKASNILLEDDFTPKVSDFGLARSALDGDNKHISTRVMGTFGYVAPEYAMTGHLLVKSDVYSYGVVLLELLTGRKPVDMSQPSGQENLVTWARPLLTSRESLESIIDPSLGPDFPFDSIAKVAAIASMCVQPEVSHRPFMGEVVQALKLVCDECNEIKELRLYIDTEARSITNSGPLFNQSPVSNYDYRFNVERDLSMSELLSSSRQDCESFRRHSSSGPLRTGKTKGIWNTMRRVSRGSVSEHGVMFSYEATSSRKNRSLAKELTTGAVASVFLGFGSLFLLLSSGVYV